MLTFKLPNSISSIEEAKAYMDLLAKHNFIYHPEDSSEDIEWNDIPMSEWPTPEECAQMDKLMDNIYDLPGNEDRSVMAAFDPCGYLLDNNKF